MTRWPVNIPLVASLVAIAFASIVMAAQFVELASAVLTPSPRPDPTRARLDDYIAEHGDAMSTYRGRFDGRSLWFKPKAPPKAPRVNIVKRDEPSEPPPPPPPPSKPRTYPGPSVSFVVGDDVWFHDGVHASVGGEEVNGVTVVAADPPWTVTLEYGGWEYVLLWPRCCATTRYR